MYLNGESNTSIVEGIGKPIRPQPRTEARATVFKRGEPIGYDPKPSDLHAGRAKRGESHVEARRVGVLQYPPMTCA